MNDHDAASLQAARDANERGELADWVAEFLSSPGSDNPVLARELADEKSSWFGPVELRFADLHRLAGPPDQPTLERLGDDDLETVDSMEDSIDDGWEPPPLIVSFRDGHFVVEDGNHRIEGLRQAGSSAYWSVVGFDDESQRRTFLNEHSTPGTGAP